MSDASTTGDPTPDFPKLDDLIGQMKGVGTTQQWDVVCSYSLARLNDILAQGHQQGTIVSKVKMSSAGEDVFGTPYSVAWELDLAAPTLEFIPGTDAATLLTMPIASGSYVTTSGDAKTTAAIAAATYVIRARVPLQAVKGETNEVADSGTVVTLKESGCQHHIVLHFASANATFEAAALDAAAPSDPLIEEDLGAAIKDYFATQVSAIDYTLCSVANPAADDGKLVLDPVSFVFATRGDTVATGVLSVFIRTRQSSRKADGVTRPVFQPGGADMGPIPDGYQASVILSQELMAKVFLEKQLTQAGYGVSAQAATSGIRLDLTSKDSVVVGATESRVTVSDTSYGGLDFPIHDPPLELSVADGALQLRWSSKATSDWTRHEDVRSGGRTVAGAVELSLKLDYGPLPLKLGSDSDSDSDSFTFADVVVARDDLHPEAEAVVLSQADMMAKRENDGIYWSNNKPSYYDDLQFQIPALKLSLPGLDFFTTANIVLPTGYRFTLAQAPGIKTPHDFLLLGNITKDDK